MLHEQQKRTILDPCVEIPPRRLKLILTPNAAKPASFTLEIYSLGLFGNLQFRGYILIITTVPKE